LEPVTLGFNGTIVGTVAGASASILTTVIAERNRRSIRRDEATYARAERAQEFQCNNLLKVQDVLSSTMRLMARANLEDMNHYRNWLSESEPAMLSEDLDNEIHLSNKELSILSERISDDLLRENIKLLQAKMSAVSVAKSAEESENALEALSYAFGESMAKIGIVLRNTF
jgi:gas vesicle protein